jgi:hypothetical protein
MDWKVAWLAVALCSAGAGSAGLWAAAAQARGAPLIRNPVVLNIGFVCRWQDRCIRNQQRAMRRALKHVAKYPPATWRIQLCNRNASRGGTRVDWIGFNNCIRNQALRPPPPPPPRRKRRR